MRQNRRPLGVRGLLGRRVVESRKRHAAQKARALLLDYVRGQRLLASFDAMQAAGLSAWMDDIAFRTLLNCRCSIGPVGESAFGSVSLFASSHSPPNPQISAPTEGQS